MSVFMNLACLVLICFLMSSCQIKDDQINISNSNFQNTIATMHDVDPLQCQTEDSDADRLVRCTYQNKITGQLSSLDCSYNYTSYCIPYNKFKNAIIRVNDYH